MPPNIDFPELPNIEGAICGWGAEIMVLSWSCFWFCDWDWAWGYIWEKKLVLLVVNVENGKGFGVLIFTFWNKLSAAGGVAELPNILVDRGVVLLNILSRPPPLTVLVSPENNGTLLTFDTSFSPNG